MAIGTVWSTDTVTDVAESIGIGGLNEEVAQILASDVEYRLHEVIQEASKFMRHAKRTILSPADINEALRALNVEPLYGYAASRPIVFKEASLSGGGNQPSMLYYLEDTEVDFEKIVNQPLPKLPREVSLSAHWLAIEGVQPAIPQNPTLSDSKQEGIISAASTSFAAMSTSDGVDVRPMVKHVLSKELQLYFERTTGALLNDSNDTLRDAALYSLKTDPGLHQLVPYFVQFIAEKTTHELKSTLILTTMLHVTWAMLDNPNIFIEPYLQQLMPSVLTCLVAKRIGESNAPADAHIAVRNLAASVLAIICNKYGMAYHTLKPRVTRTLLKTFLDNKMPTTSHYGAIIGIATMGPQAVRVLVLPNAKFYIDSVLKDNLELMEETAPRINAERCLHALKDALLSIGRDVPDTIAELPYDSENEVHEALEQRIGDVLTRELRGAPRGVIAAILE